MTRCLSDDESWKQTLECHHPAKGDSKASGGNQRTPARLSASHSYPSTEEADIRLSKPFDFNFQRTRVWYTTQPCSPSTWGYLLLQLTSHHFLDHLPQFFTRSTCLKVDSLHVSFFRVHKDFLVSFSSYKQTKWRTVTEVNSEHDSCIYTVRYVDHTHTYPSCLWCIR